MDILDGLDCNCNFDGHEPKYRQIAKRIASFLQASNTPEGSKLPNDKELARRFNVAVMTMAQALNELAARGMLERCVGAGTFVRTPIPSTATASRRIAIVCHQTITMEGGFGTGLLLELYRRAPEFGFDMIQLRRTPDEYERTFRDFGLHGIIVLSEELTFLPELSMHFKAGMNLAQVGIWYRNYNEFSFGTDHALVAKQAVKYLHGLGHSRIGVFNGLGSNRVRHYSSTLRINGYMRALKELDLPFTQEWLISYDETCQGLYEKLACLKESGNLPSAFLVLKLPQSPRIYDIIERLDLKIPDDISLVGFDEPYSSERRMQSLTTFSQNLPELVNRVLTRLDKPRNSTANSAVPSLLIERNSCKCLLSTEK